MAKNDGGPAFPRGLKDVVSGGLTKREAYALAAMGAMARAGMVVNGERAAKVFATNAFILADAMIEEGAKNA